MALPMQVRLCPGPKDGWSIEGAPSRWAMVHGSLKPSLTPAELGRLFEAQRTINALTTAHVEIVIDGGLIVPDPTVEEPR